MRRCGVWGRLGSQLAGQGSSALSKAPTFLPDLALASGDALLAPAANALAFRRQPSLRATFASSPMYHGPIGSNLGGSEGMGAGIENPAVSSEEFAKAATRQHMSTDAVGPIRGPASEQIKMTDGEAVKRAALPGLCLTVALGVVFTMCQAFEYYEAALTISDGYYGTAFYTATGFHGNHVIIGTVFLLVSAIRMARGQFAPTHHLGF